MSEESSPQCLSLSLVSFTIFVLFYFWASIKLNIAWRNWTSSMNQRLKIENRLMPWMEIVVQHGFHFSCCFFFIITALFLPFSQNAVLKTRGESRMIFHGGKLCKNKILTGHKIWSMQNNTQKKMFHLEPLLKTVVKY